MYQDLLNSNVSVFVTPRGGNPLEYRGVLIKEEGKTITLSNVQIRAIVSENFRDNSLLNGPLSILRNNLSTTTINKDYIVSVNVDN